MLTCIDVKFIFDPVRLGLYSSANILQIADVALRVVFLLFLPCFLLSFRHGGAKVQVTGHRSGHRPGYRSQATGQVTGHRPQATGQVTGQITGHTQKQ